MSQSILLPAFVALFGVVAAMFLVGGSSKNAAAQEPVLHSNLSRTAPRD
jgi:hypothetical protein